MNFISRVSAANEWGIVLATRKQKSYLMIFRRLAYQAAVHERSPHFSLNLLSSWGSTLTGLEKTAEIEPRFSEDYRSLSADFRTSSKNCPKVTRTLRYTFWKNPKIPENYRRLSKQTRRWGRSKDVLIINEFKYCLGDTIESIKPIESGLSGG